MKRLRSPTSLIFAALIAGVVLGGFLPEDQYPTAYDAFHFLAKAFISLIKGLIVPLLVSTIIVGVAQAGDLKAVGRMGAKALLYFEVVTSVALMIGLFVANTLRPGDGLPLDIRGHVPLPSTQGLSGWDVALHAFPSNVIKHAADGDILPVVVFATLFGVSLTRIGEKGRPVFTFFEAVAQAMFKYTDLIMRLTPLGVFGALAYNVSHMASGQMVDGVTVKGWEAVGMLLRRYVVVVGSLYLSLALMIALVFVPVLLLSRTNVRAFFRAISAPVLTAFSTASSEAALPKLLEEIVRFGVPRRVAGFVIPAGYSFNLDGSTLYLVLASLTIAQAAHVELSLAQQIGMTLTFILTSKGVAAVPRATLVIIAATCDGFGIPGEAGVAMLLAIDSVMDMARSATNLIGNALASVVIAKWEKVFGAETQPSSAPLANGRPDR